MMNQAKTNGKYITILFVMFWLMICLVTTIKVLFFGTDLDEQYAISMGYRMACGDRMFLEMWEPHQTSAFFVAFLIKLYISFSGSMAGLVIFLRFMGVCMQLIVSICVYVSFCKFTSNRWAFLSAIAYYQILPKYNQTPEFSNMFLWFSTLMFLCLLNFFAQQNGHKRLLFFSAIFTCLMILSYPTSIVAVLGIVVGIIILSCSGSKLKNLVIYMGTCIVGGIAYIAYFLGHMSMQDFLYGIKQMTTDGSHSQGFSKKMLGYVNDLRDISIYIVVILSIALIIWLILRKCIRIKQISFVQITLLVSIAQQFWIWFFLNEFLKYPSIFYFLLFLCGLINYCISDNKSRVDRVVFWFGSLVGVLLLCAALMASNMKIYESSEYMATAFLATFLLLGKDSQMKKKISVMSVIVILAVIGALAFRKGFLMYFYWGKETILVTKQKTLSAPMDNIYCRWSDGVTYNTRAELLEDYVPRGSKVLYLGEDTIVYLQGEYEICNYSTISTPTFDKRLFVYWDMYPDHRPEYIIWNKTLSSMSKPKRDVRDYIENSTIFLGEEEEYRFYQVK